MKKIWISCLLAVYVCLISCNKSGNEIDLSQQVQTDYNGNYIGGNADGQWIPLVYSSQEQNLFSGLDTADLTGTVAPDSDGSAFFFPNPFGSVASMIFTFASGYNGAVVFKWVIVDNHMNIKAQGASKIHGIPDINYPSRAANSDFIHLSPDIPLNKYRIYFTLSSASHPHFYKSWGNIQKTQ